MKNFLEAFAKDTGFCCPYRFLRTIKRHRTRILALYYGVSSRTIRNWKAKLHDGTYSCPCVGLRAESRQKAGWAPCMRGKEQTHPLDDPNTVRRYTDKYPGTSSEVIAELRSRGPKTPDSSSN